jgi:hypothetical protein
MPRSKAPTAPRSGPRQPASSRPRQPAARSFLHEQPRHGRRRHAVDACGLRQILVSLVVQPDAHLAVPAGPDRTTRGRGARREARRRRLDSPTTREQSGDLLRLLTRHQQVFAERRESIAVPPAVARLQVLLRESEDGIFVVVPPFASALVAMAFGRVAMAFGLVAMAFGLVAMATAPLPLLSVRSLDGPRIHPRRCQERRGSCRLPRRTDSPAASRRSRPAPERR